MKATVSYAALIAGVLAQDVIEPASFNVTQALLDNGVDASVLPDPASLSGRSTLSGCAAAVSKHIVGVTLTFG